MSRPNLLLVCVDCLRGDFVGTDHADTPFIDELAAEGVSYTDMYATATTTTPSVASFMTGEYSEGNGVYSLEEARLADSVATLAEALSAAGYDTAALVTGPLVADTGLDRGFDTYAFRDRREELVGGWFTEAVDSLDGLEEPFFCYLHLWEIHDPVRVPDGYDDAQYGTYPYARTLAALDRRLESFCERLPAGTAIALHGDHGEAIAYRGGPIHWTSKLLRTGIRYGLGIDTRAVERRLKRLFERDLPFPDHFMEDGHGENTFDFVANVPFVLSAPDLKPETVDAQVRQIDVMPTLLDLVGIERDSERAIEGESLLPPEQVADRDAYIRACGKSLLREDNWQRAVRAGGYKYVKYPNRNWPDELYDLQEDELELSPMEDDRVATRLETKLPEDGDRDGETLAIDGLLEDLGYK